MKSNQSKHSRKSKIDYESEDSMDKSNIDYESDDSMEFFETDFTYHDYVIAIEIPDLTEGQYGLKACKDIKKEN